MASLPLFIIIPLAAAFLISLLGKRIRYFSDLLSGIASLVLIFLSVNSLFTVKELGAVVYRVGGWFPPIGICLVLDGLSSFMLVIVSVITFFVAVYSTSYMEKYTDKWKFYTLFMLMLAGMNGVILTGDIFNLFIFLEIAAIASYALVAFGTEADELEASFKYAIMGSVASSFILLGIGLLYSYTSTLNMADISVVLASKGPGKIIPFVSVLFLMGFGLKSALVPFHAWLPDAHPSAPASISAMLSGLIIKVLGVYAMVRIFFNVIGTSSVILNIFMVLGVLSMMVGVFLAISQWDLKRLLAYHSISQIGYVILGIGLGTPLGILGGLFHLLNHSVFKSLLFLNSGSVDYATGTRDLKSMGGLQDKMPVTAGTNFIASMSIAGIPPFNGFWSKLIIIFACIQAGRIGYAGWAILGSLLTLSSFMKVQRFAFAGKLNDKWKNIKEAPIAMRFATVSLAILCILLGLLILPSLRNLILDPAVEVLRKGILYSSFVLGR